MSKRISGLIFAVTALVVSVACVWCAIAFLSDDDNPAEDDMTTTTTTAAPDIVIVDKRHNANGGEVAAPV